MSVGTPTMLPAALFLSLRRSRTWICHLSFARAPKNSEFNRLAATAPCYYLVPSLFLTWFARNGHARCTPSRMFDKTISNILINETGLSEEFPIRVDWMLNAKRVSYFMNWNSLMENRTNNLVCTWIDMFCLRNWLELCTNDSWPIVDIFPEVLHWPILELSEKVRRINSEKSHLTSLSELCFCTQTRIPVSNQFVFSISLKNTLLFIVFGWYFGRRSHDNQLLGLWYEIRNVYCVHRLDRRGVGVWLCAHCVYLFRENDMCAYSVLYAYNTNILRAKVVIWIEWKIFEQINSYLAILSSHFIICRQHTQEIVHLIAFRSAMNRC